MREDDRVKPQATIVDPGERQWIGWGNDQTDCGRMEWKTLISADLTPTAELTAGVGRIAPGEELAEHSHSQSEVYVVLDGTATLVLDGERRSLAAGGAVFIPGGVRHGCRNEGAGELRFVYCFPADSSTEVEYDFGGP